MSRAADVLLAGVLLALCLSGGCDSGRADRAGGGRLPAFAGIAPVAYLVEQIGGERVEVEALVHPAQDPHTFEPTPRQIAALGKAAIFFAIDMPFETALLEKVRAGSHRLEVVDVSLGIRKRTTGAPCCAYSAGHDHDRSASAGLPDPHVWLSPPLLAKMGENVAAALCRADPAHAGEYKSNLAALGERLDLLHKRIGRMLTPHRGRSFYVFHPGFGYFADAYGLKEEAVEAGGQTPAPKQLRALIEKARAEGAKTVFVQPQYDSRSAQIVADAIGGKVVQIDGLRKNVVSDIEEIAGKIDAALRESPPPESGER